MSQGSPGVYHLLVHLPRGTRARVGKLGAFTFPGGYYVYTGSAMSGLEQRLARHRRRCKKAWWHIDYLLRAARIERVVAIPTARRCECARNLMVLGLPGARVVAPGFGSSDCRCPAHLAYFGRSKPELEAPTCQERRPGPHRFGVPP